MRKDDLKRIKDNCCKKLYTLGKMTINIVDLILSLIISNFAIFSAIVFGVFVYYTIPSDDSTSNAAIEIKSQIQNIVGEDVEIEHFHITHYAKFTEETVDDILREVRDDKKCHMTLRIWIEADKGTDEVYIESMRNNLYQYGAYGECDIKLTNGKITNGERDRRAVETEFDTKYYRKLQIEKPKA